MCGLSLLTDIAKRVAEDIFLDKKIPTFSSIFESLVVSKARLEPITGKRPQDFSEDLRTPFKHGCFQEFLQSTSLFGGWGSEGPPGKFDEKSGVRKTVQG